MIAGYRWRDSHESMFVAGDGNRGTIIAALPPFEEANRVRALAMTVLRNLAGDGWRTAVPDLPGAGESLLPTEAARLRDWREAFAAAATSLPGPVHIMSIRGGALIDGAADVASRWRLSPQNGSSLLRELMRTGKAGAREAGLPWPPAADATAMIAGNAIAPELLAELGTAQIDGAAPLRTIRLAGEAGHADARLDGPPLWRRAEPGNDAALAKVIANNIAGWISDFPVSSVRPEPVEGRADKTRASTSSARTVVEVAGADDTLAGTLDTAPGATGLLIVSGGNEIRIGAHRGMALLAERIAAAGYPVFRFDRRGVGDSTGQNSGFANSADDIAAAAGHFRERTGIARMLGFGICDAATALALFGGRADLDGLILANPWVREGESDLPPAAAIRARYVAKLRDFREWRRLAGGEVDLGKLWRGLQGARDRTPGPLAPRVAEALGEAEYPVKVLTARGDHTAIAFRDALPQIAVIERDTASHSFAGPGDADWLFERIIEKLRVF